MSPQYIRGPTTTMIHAPSVNLASTKTSTTIAVTEAEVALMTTPTRHLPVRSRRWRATMPEPASVNPVNTPMA